MDCLAVPPQHTAAAQGMAAADFHIISHGNPPATVASGSGVLLAVRSGYAGSWQAVAATVVSSNGTSLRFAAIYGPTGACLPGFSGQLHLNEEANLKTFFDSQIDFATSNHLQLTVGGDLNSFCSDHLDRWGGSYVLRPGVHCSTLGPPCSAGYLPLATPFTACVHLLLAS